MERNAVVTRTGGPEVIEIQDVDLPPPGPGQVRLKQTAIGVNYIDVYLRRGAFSAPLPMSLGFEAAGTVTMVGDNVTKIGVGDRVATMGPSLGAYSTARNINEAELFRVPDTIDNEAAAAVLLKGATVEALVERCAKVQRGQTILVHAAAGGVGQMLVGWLKAVGATVIGSVGSAAKAARARSAGADHVLLHREDDVAARVRDITDGAGVAVVFDGVGKAMWEVSLRAVARRGLIVNYGNAGGAIDGTDLAGLQHNGSCFFTQFNANDYYALPAEREAGVARLWHMVESGAVKPVIGQRFTLDDVNQAHMALESGETEGSTVLIP